MTWPLGLVGGATKTFAAWGFTGLRRTTGSQVIDIATFEEPVQSFAEDTQLQPDDTVKIYRDGVKWFEGLVTQTPLTALPDAETHGYVVSGPWHHFENNVYKQPWLAVGGSVNIGHIFLNITVGQVLFPTNLQMESICNWLLSLFPAGAKPFQIGTISPVAYPPVSEINAITCAAAMRGQMRWIQNAVASFDYSTSPPTINVRQRGELPAVTITIPDKDMSACQIVPRYDLLRPSVSIHYEITSVVNGMNKLSVSFDTAPGGATGNEPGALNLAMSLQGPTRNFSYAELLCDTIDTSSVAWWKNHIPFLKDPRIANIEVTGITRLIEDGSASQQLPRELIEGQITDWMDFSWDQEIITGKFTYEFYDRDAADPAKIKLGTLISETIAVNLVATDAATGPYQNVTTSDTGDPLPANMAQFLYDALSVLHYDGTFTLVEEEITGQVGIGNVVNLAGGRAAWTTMNALVQGVVEDVDTGTTQVRIGPPTHLGHDDLMELLRVGRRFRWTPLASQETGELGDSGQIKLGKPTANRNTSPGERQLQYQVVQTAATPADKIKIDAPNKTLTVEQTSGRNVSVYLGDIPADVPQSAMPIKLRVVEGCGPGNVPMLMVVLGSGMYPIPT